MPIWKPERKIVPMRPFVSVLVSMGLAVMTCIPNPAFSRVLEEMVLKAGTDSMLVYLWIDVNHDNKPDRGVLCTRTRTGQILKIIQRDIITSANDNKD